MSSTFTPDPYKVLGVSRDAVLADIRSAYKKLVLKCHPDKVQDEALKAIKQDEFQNVQQAYELLSDDSRRTKYDDQQKLFDLRKEMGRSAPPPGKNVFEYEVRTAEPRSTTFRSKPKEFAKAYSQPAKVFMQPSPRSYEDDLASRSYEEPLKAKARKAASYEERKRPSFREEEKRKKSDEERDRDRWEKEAKKSSHSASKKSRDKERKKDSESKYSRTAFVVDADDSDEYYRPRMEKKTSRRSDDELTRAAEKLRQQEEHLLHTDRSRKLDAHKDFAAQYMQAARRKVEPEPEFRPTPTRRAETFQEPSYSSRYTPAPQAYVDEDDLPRRSSARRASEQIPTRTRERPRSSEKEKRRSPSYEPVIVDAAPAAPRIPSLQSHSSAPPMMAPRKEPHRSKTMDYSKKSVPAPPSLPRAFTFQSGDNRSKPASRGSKLKNPVEYSDDSDSDSSYGSPRATTPPRRRDHSPTRYVIEKGRSVPVGKHRSELRDDDNENRGHRSESPRGGGRHSYSTERPPLMRSGGSSSYQPFSRPHYGSGMSPEPIIKDVRPKMPGRESSSRSTSSRGPFFAEVQYAPNYGPENVSYTPMDHYRRGSDPTHHRDYAYPPRPSAYT